MTAKAPKTNDIDLRLAVTRALLDAGIQRDAIRHEITLDSSSSDGRADMVVAMDHCLTGIEIKSGKDTLDRLGSQRERYSARFDRLCLVIDKRHEPTDYQVAQHIKFGAVRVFEAGAIRSGGMSVQGHHVGYGYAPWEREPDWHREHSERQSPHAMLSMLWAHEALMLSADLVQAGVIPRATGGHQRCRVIPHTAEHAPIAQLRPRIAATLRARVLNRWEEAFWTRYDAIQPERIAA